jgi:DNA-binding PadR family transcriptional regulator
MSGLVRYKAIASAIPAWLPDAARRYFLHVQIGVPLRELARGEGCHASTVLRQVRRFEERRDDPLVNEAFTELLDPPASHRRLPGEDASMTAHPRHLDAPRTARPDTATIEREARRILRRLSESGAMLAVSPGLDRAVVLREGPGERPTSTAVLDRAVAQAFALKDWIQRKTASGRVATYEITAAGKAALKRLLADDHAGSEGFAEAPARFGEQHREWGERFVADAEGGEPKKLRYNLAESPLALLARRKEKDGKPFLTPDLVAAGERLREDFELAQMGPRIGQNWDRFLTAGIDRGQFQGGGPASGPEAARARVASALAELGPGLGDMVLRVCCFLEGIEAAEKRMGWSARSGKIVLRIALIRLRRHYDALEGRHGALMG